MSANSQPVWETCDNSQSCCLKQIVIDLFQRFLFWVGLLGWGEAASLIDDFQLLSHVIVESVEANQKCWNARRKGENARLGKGVRLQQSIHVTSDLVLLFLAAAIQRRQVE